MDKETHEAEASADVAGRTEFALLDCPFCGGNAGLSGGCKTQEPSKAFCVECYAEIPGRGLHHDHANEAWNRRINDTDVLNEWEDMMEGMNIGGVLDLAIKLTRGEARKRAI